MAMVPTTTDALLGVIYLCSYFLKTGPLLGLLDQVGLVLLIAGVVIFLGICIKIRLIGQMRWTFATKFFNSVMEVPVRSDGIDGIAAKIITTIIRSVVMVCFALILGLLGAALDVALELLTVLALLVPVAILLGIQLKRRLAPETLETICPVLGRLGLFLHLALLARVLGSRARKD
ncbi:unnamed protein product [Durusdinium trenchii]|uniref:Uncharacterized protein n=2 Tax=Durusdinium trenchii TaxID=1381693 RepID=A0ABP0P5M8_9DINO